MTLYGMMEIFHRHPELQQHLKNNLMMGHPPPQFHPMAMARFPMPPSTKKAEKPKASFLISDILNGSVGKSSPEKKEVVASQQVVVRPWDGASSRSSSPGLQDDEEIDVGEERPKAKTPVKGSPLDALFKMTNKTFDGNNSSGILSDGDTRDQMNGIFSKAQPSKKRRKSRTAFSNHQIYELEKRFLYQKYLTPADRDEIAQQLSLSNAQVITWFQNRRAKLKRDLEELKADMSAAKILGSGKEPPTILTKLEEMQAYTTRQSLIKWEKRTLSMKGDCSPSGFNPLSILDEHRNQMIHSPDAADGRLSESSHCGDLEHESLPETPAKHSLNNESISESLNESSKFEEESSEVDNVSVCGDDVDDVSMMDRRDNSKMCDVSSDIIQRQRSSTPD